MNNIDALLSMWVQELMKGTDNDTMQARHIEELRTHNEAKNERT